MTRLKSLSVALAIVAILALVLGVSGFDQVTADRGVVVETADDDAAFTGVHACYESEQNTPDSGGSSDTRVTVQVTNRFESQLTVESITADRPRQDDGSQTIVKPGDAERVTAVFSDRPTTVYVDVSTGSAAVSDISAPIRLSADCPFSLG